MPFIRLACCVDMHFAVLDYTLLYQHRTDSLVSSGSFYLHLFSNHFSHNIPSSGTGCILIWGCTVFKAYDYWARVRLNYHLRRVTQLPIVQKSFC